MTPSWLLGPFKPQILPGSITRAVCVYKCHYTTSHNQRALVLAFPPIVNSFFLEFKRQWCLGLLIYPSEIYLLCLKDLLHFAFLQACGLGASTEAGLGCNRVNNSASGDPFLQPGVWALEGHELFCLWHQLRLPHATLPSSLAKMCNIFLKHFTLNL